MARKYRGIRGIMELSDFFPTNRNQRRLSVIPIESLHRFLFGAHKLPPIQPMAANIPPKSLSKNDSLSFFAKELSLTQDTQRNKPRTNRDSLEQSGRNRAHFPGKPWIRLIIRISRRRRGFSFGASALTRACFH